MKFHFKDCNKTSALNFVGVNFYKNPSLAQRYEDYLTKSCFTAPDLMLSTNPDCVIVATSSAAPERPGISIDQSVPRLLSAVEADNTGDCSDPLIILTRLSERTGFTRCSGRLFAGHYRTEGELQFVEEIQHLLPPQATVRVHCYPGNYTNRLLDRLDECKILKEKNVVISPTNPTHLLVAVLIDNSVCWGVFTEAEYRASIARPGDGNRNHIFPINFNKAQSKVAEALQLLNDDEEQWLLGGSAQLLAVDVGAAPGGWSAYLAALPQAHVVAVDPAELEPSLLTLPNLRHLRLKAEQVVKPSISEGGTSALTEGVRKCRINTVNRTDTDDVTSEKSEIKTRIDCNANADTEANATTNSEADTNTNTTAHEDDANANIPGAQTNSSTPLDYAASDLLGPDWKKNFRLLTCDANLDARDAVRELVLPFCTDLAPGGFLVLTLKLGRRVGGPGVCRKVAAVQELLLASGHFDACDIRPVAWLFSNSKNERTVLARKRRNIVLL